MSKTLIIDPGHGGSDPGANGFGVKEKDWTLKISLYQYNRLKELGAKVFITRTTDKFIDSTPRGNLIKSKYDYCMSNHFNAFNGSARGVETIHSIHSNGNTARKIAEAIVKTSGLPLRRVFDRKGNSGDYYFMHRLTGNTETTISEYGFIDNKTDHDYYKNESNFYKVAEAVVKVWCGILGVKYTAPGKTEKPAAKPKPTPTPTPSKPKEENKDQFLIRVKVNDLHTYTKADWNAKKGAPIVNKNEVFTVVKTLTVNGSKMYQLKSGWYITAASKYVELYTKPKPKNDPKPKPVAKPATPSYVGKRVESKHSDSLRFYAKPSWEDKDVAGRVTKGYGFPTIVSKVKVGNGYQYKVKNSKGKVFYITAASKYVKVV